MPSSSRRLQKRSGVAVDADVEIGGVVVRHVERLRGDDLPAVEHDNVVADPLHVVEDVRGEHHQDAELPVDAADQVEHLLPAERIEPVRRLVEEDQLGIVHDRLGELHPLFHAGRESFDQPVALFVETDLVEHVGRSLPRGAPRQPAHLRHVGDEIGGGGVVGQGVRLRHVADPHPQLATVRDRIASQHPRACRRSGGRARAGS